MSSADGVTDPTSLYRIRDGAFAADLLIAAIADFDLFTCLDRGPTPSAELRAELGLAERPADVLLTYCAALGLINRDLEPDDVVSLTALSQQHLVAGSPFDLRPYYQSLAERPAARELAEILRTDGQAAWSGATAVDGDADWSGRLDDQSFAVRITAAMDARGAFLGPALREALSDVPVSNLLDVAGSSGVYAAAVLQDRPHARAAVFERAPVDFAARTLLETRGLADRIEVITGDMFIDRLPEGFDVHLYSHVLHDWGSEGVHHLLAASFESLPPGGWVIDHDMHVDADKRGPLSVAEYSVLLMHSTPGKCWSVGELATAAERVGFVGVEFRPTAGDRSVLLARRP